MTCKDLGSVLLFSRCLYNLMQVFKRILVFYNDERYEADIRYGDSVRQTLLCSQF